MDPFFLAARLPVPGGFGSSLEVDATGGGGEPTSSCCSRACS